MLHLFFGKGLFIKANPGKEFQNFSHTLKEKIKTRQHTGKLDRKSKFKNNYSKLNTLQYDEQVC